MGMGEQGLDNLSMSEQAKHEQVMASAGKKLGAVLERNSATPDTVVTATEQAMKYVAEGRIPAGETPDSDTAEIYGVMNEVAELYKINGRQIDPRKIVEELLLSLPTKSGSPGVAKQQILQAVQSVTGALSEFDVKAAPPDSDGPVVSGKPYSQELLEQSTQKPKAAIIKPHGLSVTNAVVMSSVALTAIAGLSVIYGFSSLDMTGIVDKAKGLLKTAQERGLVPTQNEVTADKGRSKDLSDLFAKDPFNLYKEGGWNNLFNASGVTEASAILVKYYGPDWWTKLLDKYPSTGDKARDEQVEQNRQFALEAIRKQLKESSVKDLERYRGHPNKIWTRLKDTGHTDAINSLYRVIDNPDKNDFADFTLWQNGNYGQITNRPEERDWKIPIPTPTIQKEEGAPTTASLAENFSAIKALPVTLVALGFLRLADASYKQQREIIAHYGEVGVEFLWQINSGLRQWFKRGVGFSNPFETIDVKDSTSADILRVRRLITNLKRINAADRDFLTDIAVESMAKLLDIGKDKLMKEIGTKVKSKDGLKQLVNAYTSATARKEIFSGRWSRWERQYQTPQYQSGLIVDFLSKLWNSPIATKENRVEPVEI